LFIGTWFLYAAGINTTTSTSLVHHLPKPPTLFSRQEETRQNVFRGERGPGPPNFGPRLISTGKAITTSLADVMFHANGVLRDTDYRVSVATDRKSISWQRAIQTICFSKKILEAILKNA
jgi:hypothetical protein